jgi:hypothetical protein
MTKCLKKPCFKLSEAANTWGIFPRCAELGRAVAYFEIALTLGLKPQASTKIYLLFLGVMTGVMRLFSYHTFCCSELEREKIEKFIFKEASKGTSRMKHKQVSSVFVDPREVS